MRQIRSKLNAASPSVSCYQTKMKAELMRILLAVRVTLPIDSFLFFIDEVMGQYVPACEVVMGYHCPYLIQLEA